MNGTDFWTLAVIVGLAGVTVLTRSFSSSPTSPGTCPAGRNVACNTPRITDCP